MIPKIIHYCWFGENPLPSSAKRCIESWKKYCPDYEIRKWSESNFDISCCNYVKEAYEAKKWAFVSDVARFKILYENGGIYFDTDVELLRPINQLVEIGPFMGLEDDGEIDFAVAPGIGLAANPGLGLAANPGLGLYKEIIDSYEGRHFIKDDGTMDYTTVVETTTEILKKHGLRHVNGIQQVEGIYIYPKEYFCPKSFKTSELQITENTYAIHHFDSSWLSDEEMEFIAIRRKLYKLLPEKASAYLARGIAVCRYRGIKTALNETVQWIGRNAGKNE